MFIRYTLSDNDNLESVSKKFGVSKDYIQDINNMYYEELFRTGKEIIVPAKNKNYYDFYTIEKGDSLYAIARKYNINPELLSNINGIEMEDYIYPGQQLLIPKSGYSYYITAEGDTLNTIADAFGTNIKNLLDENEGIYLMADQLLVHRKK